ncbi:MAG: membrane protein insertion efficiency factor YidD [Parvularcula sp.]|jgi:putative membrane protein insertion efficiency factor|nr:membrane protein insertion efficiency factor YidD [Parvularcula sp.]
MLLNRAAEALILVYRYTLSPFLQLSGMRCRHEPSCSNYGLQAFRKHPPSKAARLTAKRILNCRPGGTSGYDPVP